MSIFSEGQKTPKTVNNTLMTQSTQGYPIPAALGQVRIHQSLMFIGPMQEQKVSGAKGGGKGANSYLYYATVVAALSATEVSSIGSVWAGQSWLSTLGTNEGISVVAHYSPSSAALLIADNGVTLANTYSDTYTDYGQPASTVLNGTDNAPMQLVAYNYAISPAANSSALTTGQYSISTASLGTFTLSAVANASGGHTVYTGTFSSPSGSSNGFVGFKFVIAGFTHAANNGTFTCTASSATSITLNNAIGVVETHAGTAKDVGSTYHFSSADAGKTANVWYQLNYSLLVQQDIDVIPSSSVIGGTTVPYSVQVSNQYTPTSNINVQYYGENNPNAGVTLTQVSGTPTVAGTYKFVGAASIGGSYYTYYQFSAADLGNEIIMTWGYTNQSAVGQSAPELINFELFGGGQGQAVWPFLENGGSWQLGGGSADVASGTMPGDPGQALGYTKISYVGYGPMFLGESAQVQDNTFEILTPDAFGGGITDCNPVQCIYRVLTDNSWGLGSGTVPFPVSAIDNGSSGSWGGAVGTPGTRSVSSTAWNWFAANNFFISPKLDSQESAASVIGKWLEAGMCAAFMSEGLLKLVPYGSTSAAANGCTWIGPQSYVAALDDTCFVSKEGEDPVKLTRSPWQDVITKTQIGFCNRANQYQDDVCQESDQAAINRFGLRVEEPVSFDFIKTLTSATFAANMRVKRSTSIRNTYEFVLPFIYSYLEPMDIVTLTTSSAWAAGLNNVNLSVNNLPVRITKVEDDPAAGIKFTCEDYQALAAEPVLFNKQISSASVLVNQWAQPGNSEVVMFEATSRLTKQQGNTIMIGACGTTAQWGGCNIWVSRDGENYTQVGTIEDAARIGVLADSFASGSDPDTVNYLVVDLAENCSPLDAGSDADADNNVTMCFIGSTTAEEVISYSVCVVTGDNQYSMGDPSLGGYIRRGQMGTSINSFAAGSLFMRLDDSVFQYQYDPTWAGQTLYFKFQSFNQFNNNAQPLPSLTATAFTVPGLNPGTIDASSGLVLNSTPTIGAGPLGWTPAVSNTQATINIGNYGYSGMSAYGSPVINTFFYARFTGWVFPPSTGKYTIGLSSDDGANLYFGGQLIGKANLGTARAMTGNLSYSANSSEQIELTANTPYQIVVEWAQGAGNYGLQLLWTLPNGTTQIIPAARLSTSDTSITSNLTQTIWNGSSGLYFPNGAGLIDPGNTVLFGPPTNGGGTSLVNGVTAVTGTQTSPQVSPNTFVGPGWLKGQAYSAAGIVDIFVCVGSTTQGYLFRLDYRNGASSLISVVSNLSSSLGTTIATAPANSAAITGWLNWDIYVGLNGYMALWINGEVVCQVADLTYNTIPSNGTYTGNQVRYFYEVNTTGKVAPVSYAAGAGSSSLNAQGSIVPTQPFVMSFSTVKSSGSNGSVTFTWSTQTVTLSDGSTISVASGSKTFSSLAVATYYCYPYIRITDNTVQWANGATPPTSNSAADAIAQNSDGCAPLSVQSVAIASGSGSGTGGGGGTSCPASNELVDVQGKGRIAVGAVKHGDMLKGYSFQMKADVYRKVVYLNSGTCAAWRVIDGHKVSPCEPVWNKDGACVPAYQVPGAIHDSSIGTKIMIHVAADEYDECNFWLFGGSAPLLVHNQEIGS
jgi:hypothetical protein